MRRLSLVFGCALAITTTALSSGAAELPKTSEECGECHKEIYRAWKTSAHAHAMEDPIFQEAFRATQAREGPGVSRLCLSCHAPLVEINKDHTLAQKITWEGVGCDVCHSLVSVDMSGFGPRQVLDVGAIKRGPIPDAESSAHEVAYSELHTTSLACAWCHEFTNSEGTSIMTTYSEWKASRWASEGKNCQDCHMARTKANVVDPKVARVAHAEVNIHEVPGGHSLDQLHKALGVIVAPRQEAETLHVEVRLTNKGAGHAVPTGMPGRRVILDVQARTSDGKTFEESRVYGKFFTDEDGSTIRDDGSYFTRGVRLESDSRIPANERKVESFHFPIASALTAYLSVRLHYEHAPTGGSEGLMRLTFYSETRTVQAKRTLSP